MDTKYSAEPKPTAFQRHEPGSEAVKNDIFFISDLGAVSRETRGAFGFYVEAGTPPADSWGY